MLRLMNSFERFACIVLYIFGAIGIIVTIVALGDIIIIMFPASVESIISTLVIGVLSLLMFYFAIVCCNENSEGGDYAGMWFVGYIMGVYRDSVDEKRDCEVTVKTGFYSKNSYLVKLPVELFETALDVMHSRQAGQDS